MDTTWNDKVWPLMEEAFPPVERRTHDGQAEIFSRREFNMRVLTQGECVTGFVTWWELPSCVFIEHLAIDKRLRGAGQGTRLLRAVCDAAQKPVVLEIEPPQQSEQALRRLHFYRKNGFVINDFPYKQQPLKAGDEPCELCIMSYRKGFGAQQFLPLKRDIYRAVYALDGEALQAAL